MVQAGSSQDGAREESKDEDNVPHIKFAPDPRLRTNEKGALYIPGPRERDNGKHSLRLSGQDTDVMIGEPIVITSDG